MEDEPSVLKELHEELDVGEFKDLSVSEITEEILKKCGGFGLFQKKLTIYTLIFVISHSQAILTMVFIREGVPFACYPSNFNESLIPPNITLDEFLNKAAVEDERCSVYNLDTKEGFYILPTSNSTKEPLQECVTQNYRMRLNYLMHGTFGIGAMILAGVAYVFPKWQHLLYASIIPPTFLFSHYTFFFSGNFWFPLILAVLGKLGATASFDGVYLTSAEIFPTAVRNGGMGTASSFARFGGLISAPMLGLAIYGSWIPLSIYGVFGIVAGLLVLLLPETKDACLLQTLEDMDNL
ncbi:uncharacterized protein LOC106880856 [Octopus bimaculoides]|nr:uncharacterized protein LOC106880856 [Octopus bimaculoides]|eukprot:XP_014786482.1 PREDICTED: uncharacterized protein LOC106880856 [Octopus bimaculoides]